ncbi:MAG TPA: heavy metal-associated domain-containing protein [archaeon]|nr:heavy metal-associated domain-containing protein [archaeon]
MNLKIKIEGMSCEGCAQSVENLLKARKLVNAVKVNFTEKKALIEFNEASNSKKEIIEAIKEKGFKVIEAE